VEGLKQKHNVYAVCLNSDQDTQAQHSIMRKIEQELTAGNMSPSRSGQPNLSIPCLIYVSAERLIGALEYNSNTFLGRIVNRLYQQKAISYFVIDECHVISEWGDGFRPQYAQLGRLTGCGFAWLPWLPLNYLKIKGSLKEI